MKKTLLLSIFVIFFFNACFSIQELNPFSNEKKVFQKKPIKIPKDAPLWLIERNIKNSISSIGISISKKQKQEKKEFIFFKQRAYINASQNLTKNIYLKTLKLYSNYLNKVQSSMIFDKDIKKISEHIALQSLNKASITNYWLNNNNELYVQIAVDSSIVAKLIQDNSKKLFILDKELYKSFLSNRAKENIINILEE